MEAVMEAQVDPYEIMEKEQEEALIRKSKSKEGIPNGKYPNATTVVPVEAEKDDEIEKTATPIVYFDEGEGDKSSCQPVGANGYTAKEDIAVEEDYGQVVGPHLVSADGFTVKEITVEIEQIPSKDLGEESEPETKEVDLKKVLAEQDTHDLYCPNCKSCITRRVILRKRKRTVQEHPDAVKREKFEDLQAVVNDTIAGHSVSEESEVFGCFQCFSLFIRTATGFEYLSNIFRGKVGDASPQDEPGTQNKDTGAAQTKKSVNCLAFFLECGRQEPQDTDKVAPTFSGKNDPAVESQTAEEAKKDESLKGNASDKPEVPPLQTPQKMVVPAESNVGGRAIGEANSRNRGMNFNSSEDLASIRGKSVNINGSQVSQDGARHEENQPIGLLGKSGTQMVQHSQEMTVSSGRNVDESVISGVILENDVAGITKYATKPSISKIENIIVKATEGHSSEQVNLSVHTDEMSCQNDKVLVAQATPKVQTSYVMPREVLDDNMISSRSSKTLLLLVDDKVPSLPISMSDETRIEVGPQVVEITATSNSVSERVDMAPNGWDILKSIVYGGLVESIVSLGVISSAAGGDAGILNTVALGLANLIGGLLVIAHNVVELKEDAIRYTELIGQRQNFWRNAVVVIVSYIVFGLIAPITYGFSFRKSDNKEYKIIAVAISSLLCIFILALGKAWFTDRSYIKKVLYYVSLGVSVSGISYVVGVLIKMLLEKFSWISESQTSIYGSSLIMGTVGTTSQTWDS